MIQRIERQVLINALPSVVWEILTIPELMVQWMGDPEMRIEINTDWIEGSPIVISGFHHAKFENKGVVLQFTPEHVLRYTHFSSLSRLVDQPENYTIIEFRLMPVEDQTSLQLTIENFPTESIMKHLEFYWATTMEIVKNTIEQSLKNKI